MKLTITRFDHSRKQTLANAVITNDNNEQVFEFCTLELPWLDNQNSVSCIPEGTYKVVARTSEKYGEHFHVLDVPNRNYILIHVGNYHTQTKGCILPGSGFYDINNDGIKDVVSSSATMAKLLELLPKAFDLRIVNA